MEIHKALQITPQEILKRPYERVIIPEEEGGFSAYIAEFEGCLAQGETADEALTTLNATAIAWIEAELEAGKDIPEPWNAKDFSGRFLLRLPKSLHQQLARFAEKEEVSLNQYLVSRLSATTRDDVLAEILEQQLMIRHKAQVVTAMKPLLLHYSFVPSTTLHISVEGCSTAVSKDSSIGSFDTGYMYSFGNRREDHYDARN